MRKAARVQYRKKQLPAPCEFCGTLIRCGMNRHVARCHLDLAQLWRCPVSWCTIWKGTPQDLDHVRGAHTVLEEVQHIRLETLFLPWTGTRQVYTDSLTSRHSGISNDDLLFSDIGLSLVHHYRVHKRGLPHVVFRRNYMSQLRALLPLPAVLPIEGGGGSPDLACSSVVEAPDVVCASPRPSRRAFARRRPTRVMETPVRIAPRLTVQDPLAAAGSVVLDCRPQVLPMDVSGTDLAEIRSMSRAGVATAVPPEREQSFGGGGGGGDLLSLICPEDELSIPASPPPDVNNEVVALSMRVDVNSELEQVFGDIGSLPTMVTPVCDVDGELRVTAAECPRIEPPGVSAFVTRPLMASSPAGPTFLSPGLSHPSTESVGVLSVPRTSPVVPAPREFLLLNAADTNHAQPEAGPSFMGYLAGGLFPTIPLTPCLATASRHGGELDVVGGGGVLGSPRFVSRGAVRHTPGSSTFRRLSAVAARHPGVSISDDILRCGERWTRFFTGIWGSSSTIRVCWSTSVLRNRHG